MSKPADCCQRKAENYSSQSSVTVFLFLGHPVFTLLINPFLVNNKRRKSTFYYDPRENMYSKKNMKQVTLIILVIGLISLVTSQDQDGQGNQGSNPLKPRRDSNVQVGIPFIFGMNLDRTRNDKDTRSGGGNQGTSNTGLDLGVLGGLVRVFVDRSRHANGTRSGPVSVSIFGIPVTGVNGRR